MKKIMMLVLTVLSLTSYGQSKYGNMYFHKLIEIEGSDFVIAPSENRGKGDSFMSCYLLFINTKTGETNKVDFLNLAHFEKPEQIKIDELGINKIILFGRPASLNKKSIDWNAPRQMTVLSTNGKERTQLTDSTLFVESWVVNKVTGTIVIGGYYDSNNNEKYDSGDKTEIGIYDLKTLKLISKI